MWPFDHVFHAYTWPGVAGWVARNTPGNLAASAIAFTAGYLIKGRSVLKDLHRKLDSHHAEQLDAHRTTHEGIGR